MGNFFTITDQGTTSTPKSRTKAIQELSPLKPVKEYKSFSEW